MDDLDGRLMRMKEQSTISLMGRRVKRLGRDVFFVDGAPTTRLGAVRALSSFTHADHRRSGGSKTMAFDPRTGARGASSFGNARPYYVIRSTDVGKALIRAFGRSWSTASFIGRIMRQDVGKLVYESDGVLQVENNEQRDRRVGGAGRTSARSFGSHRGRRSGNMEDEDEDDFDLRSEMQEGFVINDKRGYSVSLSGRHIGSFSEMNGALKCVVERMEKDHYWPNVFYVNDHGNADLIALKPKIVKGKIIKVDYKVLRSWV